MTSSSRPPFILAIAADQQGCAYHRIQMPLGLLAASNLAEGRVEMQIWPDEYVAATKPDVVIWQRTVEDFQFEHMKRYRRLLPEALFVYELDDHLGAVPQTSFHVGYIPPHLPERVAQGMSLCDRATTTTKPLAEWLRSLSDVDVHVVPNAVPMGRLHERKPRLSGKLRVGWAGGISHSGDLELLRPAMEAIGEEVTWVFMGMPIENPPCRIEFHSGVSPHQYLDAMVKLDLDLMLAPLEDNEFNRCKSNLRLLEAACVGAPVAAQCFDPYLDREPPVFAYAKTPDDWRVAVQSFMAASWADRDRSARELRAWAGRHYTLEGTREARLRAWTPEPAVSEKRWSPAPPVIGGALYDSFLVVCPGGVERSTLPSFMRTLKPHRLHSSLTTACEASLATGANVLWLRPGTNLDEAGWTRLNAGLKLTNEKGESVVASAVPLASDGYNSFPRIEGHVVVTPQSEAMIRKTAAQRLVGRHLRIPAPTGPCVLLSAAALALFGCPDPDTIGDEAALLEWGLRLVPKGMTHVQVPDAYCASLAPPAPLSPVANIRIQGHGYAQYAQVQPEPLLPTDREAMELALLHDQWAGPQPGLMGFENDYATWSALKGEPMAMGLARKVHRRVFGEPVGDAQWVVYVNEDVALRPYALRVLGEAIGRSKPDICVVYADHDMPQGGILTPDFKPDFDLELLLGRDYITPVCAIRADCFIGEPPTDHADLFHVVLRAFAHYHASGFVHVSHVLATVADGESPEVKAMIALHRQMVIQDYYKEAVTIEPRRDLPGVLSVTRKVLADPPPLVSIIIPTLGKGRLIQPCINTIRSLTTYPNWEIIVVHNGPLSKPELSDDMLVDPRIRVVRWEHLGDPLVGGSRARLGDTFNWSAASNFGAKRAKGTYYCFLNDDVNVASRSWLDTMMGQAVRPSVGAVGARLLHPMGVYQHVGVVVHEGIAGHLHKGMPVGNPGFWGIATISHECSAVTGACLLVSRTDFNLVGGFSEAFPLNYGDIDFCLRLRKRGLINIVDTAADLIHPEGTTRSDGVDFSNFEVIRKLADDNRRLAAIHPEPDPYWNRNLGIGLVQGGMNIQGLNCDSLAWPHVPPLPNAQRVLLINDLPGMAGQALSIVNDGGVPFFADMSGFQIKLVMPFTGNTPPWDVRDPDRLLAGLSTIGITKVVLRSLVGQSGAAAPVESLRCLRSLANASSIEVTVDAIDGLTVTPWREWVRANDPRVFGGVDMQAWAQAYDDLTPMAPVEPLFTYTDLPALDVHHD